MPRAVLCEEEEVNSLYCAAEGTMRAPLWKQSWGRPAEESWARRAKPAAQLSSHSSAQPPPRRRPARGRSRAPRFSSITRFCQPRHACAALHCSHYNEGAYGGCKALGGSQTQRPSNPRAAASRSSFFGCIFFSSCLHSPLKSLPEPRVRLKTYSQSITAHTTYTHEPPFFPRQTEQTRAVVDSPSPDANARPRPHRGRSAIVIESQLAFWVVQRP